MSEPTLRTSGTNRSVGPRSSLDRVNQALQARGLQVKTTSPTQLMAMCPVHDDKSPSLHVSWRGGQRGGYTLLHCFGCQARAEDLVEPLGLTMVDLFDEPLPERDRAITHVGKSRQQRQAAQRRGRRGHLPATITQATSKPRLEIACRWVEVERYPYTDLQGRLVQEVIRQECTAEGDRHKKFTQKFVSHNGLKPADFFPVLYRAPQVADAIRARETVWLLEGEKDVHTAERLGLVATTNAQGGGSFPDELVDCFDGANVIVVLDRDATGWTRGVDLHRRLTATGATVRLKLPLTDAAKSDFTDHIDAGHSIDALVDVHVTEVAAWDALASAQVKNQAISRAALEVDAHLELVAGSDEETSREHRRHARRWALETEVRHEALRDLVDRVHGFGVRVGTEWAGEAMEAADGLLRAGTQSALRCHEVAGVPIPPSLRVKSASADAAARQQLEPATDSGQDAIPGDRPEISAGTTFTVHEGQTATAPVFRILGDQIVQWEPSRRQRGNDMDEDEGSFKVILTLPVRVIKREYLEVEEPHDVDAMELMGRESLAGQSQLNPTAPRQLIAVVTEYCDPATRESMHLRIIADSWKDHSWLDALPGPVDYDHKRAGLDTVQRAILAVSEHVEDTVLYRSTGWRKDGDVHKFVHAGGIITTEGTQPAPVAFSGPLVRYNLPDPTRDAARLREAFTKHSACMLDRLPSRVAAPLLGQVFRSVLGHNPWVLTLVGPPGSYKTSVAAKVMHHLGEKWDHQKPASSMSGNGDTFNALRFKLHAAKDVLYWMDDFAPTKSWVEAQKNLEETARLIHNREERSRNSRDGMSISDGTGPRASGLATSEVMPRPGSGAERMLVVPLAKNDVDTELLFPLDVAESRYGRALLMASFIQWLASDLVSRRDGYLAQAEEYAETLTGEGETVRQSAALANTFIGWAAMTDFLVDAAAITGDERDRVLARVGKALIEAGHAAVDPDLPTRTGARVRELLAHALRTGLVHVADVRTGDCPPWPLAARLGWRKTVIELDALGQPVRSRVDRQGQQLGYVLHDPGPKDRGAVLMLESTALEAALKVASGTQAEQFQIDRNTACRALYDEGVLIADAGELARGKLRFTVKCTIHCEERVGRMVGLWLNSILGDDQDIDPDSDPIGPDGQDPHMPPSGPSGSGGATQVVEPEPLFDADPQPVDGSQQADVASSTPSEEETTQMREPTFTTRPCTDRDGVVGWIEHQADAEPCVVCGRGCGVVLSGIRVHLFCWERSTNAERTQSIPPAPPQPQVAVVAPTPMHDEPATAASDSRSTVGTRGRASAKKHEQFRAAAAVVDVDGIWLSNGDRVDLPGELQHVGDLVRVAHWLHLGTQVTKYREASAQIWVGEGLARKLGIDIDTITAADFSKRDEVARTITRGTGVVTGAASDGYSIGGKEGDALGRWTRVWKGQEKSVWVVLVPALNLDGVEVPLLQGNPDHATLARRIGLLADSLGHPYHLSGSTTGLDLMMALRWKDRETLFGPREPIPPAQMNVEADISWCRAPSTEEQDHLFVHAYDRSGSYLAGVSGLELGVGDPVHHPEGCPFTAKIPGYWLIEIPEAGDWRMPNPLDPRGANAGRTRWVTTPGLEFAVEQGYGPTIIEAYTWPEHARILDPWYERIRDARTALDVNDVDAQAARNQVKSIYAPTIGMLGSQMHMQGRKGYAPDRRHQIIAKARTNILRRVAQIGRDSGRWPVAIIADTIIYTSTEQDPVKAWPGTPAQLGRALGRYKVEGSGLLAEQLQHLTGGTYRGKPALVDDIAGNE